MNSAYTPGARQASWYFENPKLIYQGLLTNASATLYTAPAAPTSGPPPKVVIEEIVIANTDSAARTLTLYAVPANGTISNTNVLLPAVSLAANSFTRLDLQTVMEASGTLRGFADTTLKICLTVSGTEYLTLPTA